MKQGFHTTQCAVIIAIIVLLSGIVYAQTDDLADHWARTTLIDWADRGLISGYEDGDLRPNQPITRAELVCLINRAVGCSDQPVERTFPDLDPTDWFYADITAATAGGYIGSYPDGGFCPHQPVTRQELASMLSRLIRLDTDASQDQQRFADSPDDRSRATVTAVAALGLMNGYPDDTFRPSALLTRAEAVVILDRLTQGLSGGLTFSRSGSYGPTVGMLRVGGDISVCSPDLTLERLAVEGDLIITPAVGDGCVELSRIKVSGSLVINGGGSHSIILTDAEIGQMVIDSATTVRVVTKGSTNISFTTVATPAILEELGTADGFSHVYIVASTESDIPTLLRGSFEEAVLSAPYSRLHIEQGSIGALRITPTGEGTEIVIAQNAAVGLLISDAPIQVVGEGSIGAVHLLQSGVELGITPVELLLDDGVRARIMGVEYPIKMPEPPRPTQPAEPSRPTMPLPTQPIEPEPDEPVIEEPEANDPDPQDPDPDPVEPTSPSDLERVEQTAAQLAIGYAPGDSAAAVTHNLTLPMIGESGVSISWESDNPQVIAADGVVTRPTFTEGDMTVTLTATVARGEAETTKQFVLTVLKQEMTDAEAVELAKLALELPSVADRHLILPQNGLYSTTILWSTGDPSIITAEGHVTRPPFDAGDTSVDLTATVGRGEAGGVKTFSITVLASETVDLLPTIVESASNITYQHFRLINQQGDAIELEPSLVARSSARGRGQYALQLVEAAVVALKLDTMASTAMYTYSIELSDGRSYTAVLEWVDATAPKFVAGYPKAGYRGTDSLSALVRVNEDATVYYMLQSGQIPTVPTIDDVTKDAEKYVPRVRWGNISVQRNTELELVFEKLVNNWLYSLYLVAIDADGNQQTSLARLDMRTAP